MNTNLSDSKELVSPNQKFGKAYKLCHDKKIQALFKVGSKFFKFPFSVQYLVHNDETITPFQLVISVPKRNFKKAVDRNRIKRLIREAVRQNKTILESFLLEERIKLSFILIYSHKQELKFEELNQKIVAFLSQLTQEIKNEKNL